MRILLDTHALLWSALDPDKLPANIATLIVSPANIVSVSIVSYWELAIKTALGKLDIRGDILSIEVLATANGIVTLPVTIQAVNFLLQLPHHHKDPFDRLIAAMALTTGDTLVSADPIFDGYGVARLWS